MPFALPSVETDVPQLLHLRTIVSRYFLGVLLALAILNPTVCWFSGMNVTLAVSVSLFGAVLGFGAYMRAPESLFSRLVIAICLMNDYDVLIYATSYTPYQLDAHMLYFVLAAIMTGYCCWVTLAVACVHTALQHFTFNLLLPEYVYPGGADWMRFVYHAAILATQVVGSTVIAIFFHRLFQQNHAAMTDLRDASAEKEAIRRREDEQRRIAQGERERAQGLMVESSDRQKYVVERLAEGLERLAQGALDYRIDTAFSADYEELRVDFNTTMARIDDALALVARNTGAIRAGTSEISAAAEDLSRHAEDQSQSLQDTVAALDSVTGALGETAKGASRARDVVAAAKGDAEKSALVVAEAVGAMTGIEQSSKQIGQIIGVIDEIAFQTNLLALNAGVEAARAGEFGRGFAVVASEVRGLAQRSAEAAKEIKALISTSTAQVEKGVDLVQRTGDALRRIVGEIVEINGVVTEIAGSTETQSSELGRINASVSEIDQGVRRNAERFKTSYDETRSVAGQTEELERLIGFFHISDSPPTMRRAA